ncbi:MAG TPA: hypothetical protein VL614_18110 [Acetobacteraceae bacterium]|jgi:hypothetical protein|nr:hypothetical protein [Acetobacteraceae bacterium]
MPALFYFHIHRTAGTSVIADISEHFNESQILTDGGNLTMPFLQACGEQQLRETGLIHGHAHHGAAAYLQGVADAALLLRNPMDHVISCYQHLLSSPTLPWHRAATGLGFRDFIETYPRFLAIQTITLATGLGRDVRRDRIYDCLPDVVCYLDNTLLLGTVDQIDEFMVCLARIKRWPVQVAVQHLNRAAAGHGPDRQGLEAAYNEVARSAHVAAVMIAAEQTLYIAAKSIAATQRARTPLQEGGMTT